MSVKVQWTADARVRDLKEAGQEGAVVIDETLSKLEHIHRAAPLTQ
jgi:hypothetical protein